MSAGALEPETRKPLRDKMYPAKNLRGLANLGGLTDMDILIIFCEGP